MSYEFELPWPPSVNGQYRTVVRGRIALSNKARQYKSKAVAMMIDQGVFGENISGRLRVKLKLHPSTNARYDIDNWCKGVFDSMTLAKFWEDDEQVCRLIIEKCEKIKGGKVVVIVDKMDSAKQRRYAPHE